MTEKRFTVKPQDDLFAVVDEYSLDKTCVVNGIRTEIETEWLCNLMNELNNENEELKAHINDTEIAVEIATEKCMQRVFDVIDKHTDYWSSKHDLAGVDTLLRLKKELKE